MTTARVSDERLAGLAKWLDAKFIRHGEEEDMESADALRELQASRALVKDCEAYMIHRHECNEVPCTCGLSALLARIRGETT